MDEASLQDLALGFPVLLLHHSKDLYQQWHDVQYFMFHPWFMWVIVNPSIERNTHVLHKKKTKESTASESSNNWCKISSWQQNWTCFSRHSWLKTCLCSCCVSWCCGSWSGHRQPFVVRTLVYRGCPCQEAGWASEAERQPFCGGVSKDLISSGCRSCRLSLQLGILTWTVKYMSKYGSFFCRSDWPIRRLTLQDSADFWIASCSSGARSILLIICMDAPVSTVNSLCSSCKKSVFWRTYPSFSWYIPRIL